jgi:hypothetical protein
MSSFSASHSYEVTSELKAIYLSRLCFVLNFIHVSPGDVCGKELSYTTEYPRLVSCHENVTVICSYSVCRAGILVTEITRVRRRANISILKVSSFAMFMLLQEGFKKVGFA